MTTRKTNPTWDQKLRKALQSPVVRGHLVVVGVALFAVGAVTLWLLPDVSLWWVVVAGVLVGHIGLLMVFGGMALRWLARRNEKSTSEGEG